MSDGELKSRCMIIQCLFLLKRIYPLLENLIPFLFFGSLISFKIYYFAKEFDTVINIFTSFTMLYHPLPTINDPLFYVIFRSQNYIYFLIMVG